MQIRQLGIVRTGCVLAACVVLLACDGPVPVAPDVPPPDVPAAPVVNDTSYAVAGLKRCYLVGNDLTHGLDTLAAVVSVSGAPAKVHAFVDSQWVASVSCDSDTVRIAAYVGDRSAGRHTVLLSVDSMDTAFFEYEFVRSHPLYVVLSNDWDMPYDTSGRFDAGVAGSQMLHDRYPGLKSTHFVGPYAFTDSAIDSTRKLWFAERLLGYRDRYGDEIGLHVHPYCHFVELAGLDCRVEPVYPPDSQHLGYVTPSHVYPENEYTQLLACSDSVFAAWGLGKPVSFRAGGWWAELHTLRAACSKGFTVDASGCNFQQLYNVSEKIAGLQEHYDWGMATWPNMTDTVRPYYPSASNVASAEPPVLPILEIPDNGVLALYATGEDMVRIFESNLGDGVLLGPRQVSIGYHPINLHTIYLDRILTALDHMSQFSASSGNGPVVYATAGDLTDVWLRP